MKRSPARAAGAGGFTLLEVLLATALAALILSALYGTFFLSQRAVASVDDSLVRLHEARLCLDLLKREIEAALFGSDKSHTAFRMEDREIFGRQTSRLRLTCFSPSLPGPGEVLYELNEREGRIALCKEVTPFFSPERRSSFDLLEDVEAFSLEAKTGSGWVKTWDAARTGQIPAEVRISLGIRLRGGDGAGTTMQLTEVARPRIGRPL